MSQNTLPDTCAFISCNVNQLSRNNWIAYDVMFSFVYLGIELEREAKFDIIKTPSIEGNRMFFLVEHHGMCLN